MSPIFIVEALVLAVLSVSALAVGATTAARPSQRGYELLRPLTWAAVFGTLCMVGTGMTNMLVMVSRSPWSEKLAQTAAAGLAELIGPCLAVLAALTIAWGLAAIGLRRLD